MQHAFLNGRIWTGDPKKPEAQGLLAENGKILMAGTIEAVRSRMAKTAEVTDLQHLRVIPGFTDAHCHFVKRGRTLKFVDLNHTRSIRECRKKLLEAARNTAKGQWIQGFGWNENLWEEGRTPDTADLDDITPDHPVCLARVCAHAVWVNSLALRIAGIDKTSAHPPGGRIEKDPVTGKPSGIIKEAKYLIETHIPLPDGRALREAVLSAQKEAFGFGITSVHSHETLLEHDALKAVEKEEALDIKVFHSIPGKSLEEAKARGIRPEDGSDHVWYGHIKLFADGSLGARTAFMHEPYENDTSSGLPFMDENELSFYVEAAHASGFGVAIHAIGDKAVTQSLNAIARSSSRSKRRLPDRIEHIQIFREEDLSRFLSLDVTASIQPIFLPSDMDLAERSWGLSRCKTAYAWKTIIDHGIPAVFGSDSPIEPCNPMLGIHAAVNRTKRDETPKGGWFQDEKLDVLTCLQSFTLAPAILSGRPHLMGTLEPGKFADFTVLDKDLFSEPPDRIKTIASVMTVVNGNIVFQAE